MSTHGYIVARRGLPVSLEWEAGQDVETYELLEPLPETLPKRLTGARQPFDAHAHARRCAPSVREGMKAGTLRETGRHTCSCPSSPSLVTEAVAPDGRRWALITRPEVIPPAFRRAGDHDTGPSAWPLHREPSGTPHIDFARCRRCGAVYCVALTESEVRLIRTRPVYGARVAP